MKNTTYIRGILTGVRTINGMRLAIVEVSRDCFGVTYRYRNADDLSDKTAYEQRVEAGETSPLNKIGLWGGI